MRVRGLDIPAVLMTLTLWVRVVDNFALTSRYVRLRSGLDTSFSRSLQEIIQEKYY